MSQRALFLRNSLLETNTEEQPYKNTQNQETELRFSRNILDIDRKHETTKKVLSFLMLCDLGFAAVGLLFPPTHFKLKLKPKR
jgi:hypothetical protein